MWSFARRASRAEPRRSRPRSRSRCAGRRRTAARPAAPAVATTEPPQGYRLTATAGRPRIADARREGRARRSASSRGSTPTAYTTGPARWQVSYFRGRQGGRAGAASTTATGAVARGVDGLPGGVADGARLRGGLRAEVQRAVRLAAARRAVPAAVRRLRAGRSGCCTSTCSCCSRSASRTSSSTAARSACRCRSSTRCCSTCSAACCGGAPRRAARPGRSCRTCRSSGSRLALIFLVGFRVGAERDRLERDRRGLLGRDRRGPDRRRRRLYAAASPTDNKNGNVYGPVNYLRLRAVRAALPVERQLGRPAGRARRGDRVRPAHAARACSCSGRRLRAGRGQLGRSASRSRTRGPRVPYTAVRARELQLERLDGCDGVRRGRWWRSLAASAAARPASWRAGRGGEVRAAGARAGVRQDRRGRSSVPRRAGDRARGRLLRHSSRAAACATCTTAPSVTRPAATRRSASGGGRASAGSTGPS